MIPHATNNIHGNGGNLQKAEDDVKVMKGMTMMIWIHLMSEQSNFL